MSSNIFSRASDCISDGDTPLSFYHGFLAKRALFNDISRTPTQAKELAKLSESTRDWLDATGFEALGAYQEAVGGFPLPKLNQLVYVDPQRVTRLALGVNSSRNFKNKGELLYTFRSEERRVGKEGRSL